MSAAAVETGVGTGAADVAAAPELPDEGGYESGWYCVRTAPFPCPADGCDFVATYMTAAHLIVVWPAADDRMMLTYARDARDLGRNPAVVEYEPAFGRAIAYDRWVKAGRPIHGKRPIPDGHRNGWRPL